MVYEIRVKMQHSCSTLEFSTLFGKKITYQFCSSDFDILIVPDIISEDITKQAQQLFTNFDSWKVVNYNQKEGKSIVHAACACVGSTSLTYTFRKTGAIIIFPIKYQSGWEYYKLICITKDILNKVLKILDGNPISEILSIINIGDDNFINQASFVSEITNELTNNQKQLLVKAFESGYYNIPREVKMSDFAEELNISRYAVEKTIRIAENKIIKQLIPYLYLEEKNIISTDELVIDEPVV